MTKSPKIRLAPALASLIPLAGLAAATPAALPDAAPELVAAIELEADPLHGRQAYATCATCHGPDGAGRADGTFPQLAGQHAQVIMKQLVDIRSGSRDNPLMLPYARRLMDAQEIADVAGYLAALPAPAETGRGPGTDLERGAALYQRDCSRCHGDRGRGDGDAFVPALAGQHYGYLLRQVRDIAGGRRHNVRRDIAAIMRRYTDVELQALADYASRLPGRDAAPASVSPPSPPDDR
jgi:cytochrome c553